MRPPSNKQQKKGNFVDEMRKRLNSYNVEKIQLIQMKKQNQQWYKQEKKAKDALIQMGDITLNEEPSEIDTGISGWSHEKISKRQRKYKKDKQSQHQINQDSINFNTPQQCQTARGFERNIIVNKNCFQSVPSRALSGQNYVKNRNPDMIIYLKTLLNRLQSPVASKRQLKTQNKHRNDGSSQTFKLKTQQTVAKIRSSKGSLHKVINNDIKIRPKHQKDERQNSECKKPERAKFQTIDVNSENKPVAIQNIKEYQKIKRRSNHQQIDIAHEKDILQQLISGTRNRANSGHYYSQRHSTAEKFTLKNLLC